MKRAIIVLLIVLLGVGVQAFAFKTGRTYNGKPTYNVDGIEYIVVTDADAATGKVDHTGAYVILSEDKSLKFSGKVNIPSSVVIEGEKYDVVIFHGLSNYEENEDSSLEITLPGTIKRICGLLGRKRKIKSINIPTSVTELFGLTYKPDTLVIPKTVTDFAEHISVSASHIIFEDGLTLCPCRGVNCDNDSIIIPGSMKMCNNALSAYNLKYLKISKSADTANVPMFDECFCRNSYSIETIVCEYMSPPIASVQAFDLEKSEQDPQYPEVNPEDPYPYGYYPTMCDRATLYVPEEAIEAYKAAPGWKNFKTILPINDGVNDVTADDAGIVATEYHDLYGRRLEAPAERGITIRTDVYSDGTRRCIKILR